MRVAATSCMSWFMTDAMILSTWHDINCDLPQVKPHAERLQAERLHTGNALTSRRLWLCMWALIPLPPLADHQSDLRPPGPSPPPCACWGCPPPLTHPPACCLQEGSAEQSHLQAEHRCAYINLSATDSQGGNSALGSCQIPAMSACFLLVEWDMGQFTIEQPAPVSFLGVWWPSMIIIHSCAGLHGLKTCQLRPTGTTASA